MGGRVRDNPKIRIKVKVNKRRDSRSSDVSSSLDLSDESGYSGVEDISDTDEDDDEHVNAAEEKHLRLARAKIPRVSPRPPVSEDEDDGDDEAADEEAIEDDDDDDDDDLDEDAEDVESVSWQGLSDHNNVADDSAASIPDTQERRVRFDVPDSSDSDSTDTDEEAGHEFFPDIFIPQSSLDPAFRRELERNDEHDDDNDSNSGVWDLYECNDHFPAYSADHGSFMIPLDEDDDSTPTATPGRDQDANLGFSSAATSAATSPDEDDDSCLELDSDGETTDEEEMPTKLPRSKSRKEDGEEESSDSESVTLIRPRRGQPRVGRFNLDHSKKKPIAIVNPRTGKLMIFTPQGAGGPHFDLAPDQFDFSRFNENILFDEEPSATTSMVNSGNMMMSAMVSSNTFGDFMNTQAVGPEEAFFSLPTEGDGLGDDVFGGDMFGGDMVGGEVFEGFSSGIDDQSPDPSERNLQLDDFITFDEDFNGSSDEENPLDVEEDPFFTTPQRPATSSSDVTSLMNHFEHNSDIVGAFRRDQANHQLISRSKATRESLAFSGPYFEGTLRGIKEGRIPSTNVPISPLRKQRKVVDATSSPLSNMAQKRKASSEQQTGHKRQRSMPDVNVLSI